LNKLIYELKLVIYIINEGFFIGRNSLRGRRFMRRKYRQSETKFEETM
jgi:hypothetical protein